MKRIQIVLTQPLELVFADLRTHYPLLNDTEITKLALSCFHNAHQQGLTVPPEIKC